MQGIVVGVDGSDESKEALRWALEEARLQGCTLHAVHVWSYAPVAGIGIAPPPVAVPFETLHQAAKELLETVVAEVAGENPEVTIEQATVEGTAAATLIEAAEDAKLLVVGARGHGGFAGLLLGSVSDQCVHHASCPVVVVRRRSQAADT